MVLSVVGAKLVAETAGIELLTPGESFGVTVSALALGVAASFVLRDDPDEADDDWDLDDDVLVE